MWLCKHTYMSLNLALEIKLCKEVFWTGPRVVIIPPVFCVQNKQTKVNANVKQTEVMCVLNWECFFKNFSFISFSMSSLPLSLFYLQTKTTALKPGGASIDVTNFNKQEYIKYVCFLWPHRALQIFAICAINETNSMIVTNICDRGWYHVLGIPSYHRLRTWSSQKMTSHSL